MGLGKDNTVSAARYFDTPSRSGFDSGSVGLSGNFRALNGGTFDSRHAAFTPYPFAETTEITGDGTLERFEE